jgi:uncharacterized protein (TIGR00369 family)
MTRYRELIAAWLRGESEPAPVASLVGFRLTAFDGATARLEMEAGARHHNPMGQVHGGIFADLADAAMGVVFAATLDEGESFTTLELHVSYLRPVRAGRLLATARVVHRGRRVGRVECDVRDAEERLVALATSTCLVLRPGES